MLEVEVFDRGILADPHISTFKRFLSSHDTDDSDPDPLFERFQRIARKAATLQQSCTTIYVPTMRHVTARPGLASSRRGGLCLDSCELISMWSVSSPPPVHKLGSARLARTQSQSQLEPRAYMLARLNPLLEALANGDTGCLVVPGVILEELERHDRAILSTLLDILAAHDKHLAPRPPVIRIVLHESIAGIRHDHNVNAPVIEQVRGDAAILHTLMRWASSSTPSDNDVSRPPRLMRLVSNDYMILLRGYVLDWPSSNHVYMPRFYPPPPDARRSSTLPASKDRRPATAQQYQTFLSCRSPGQHGMALT